MPDRSYGRLLPSHVTEMAEPRRRGENVSCSSSAWPSHPSCHRGFGVGPNTSPSTKSPATSDDEESDSSSSDSEDEGEEVVLHIYSVTRLSAIQRANGVLGALGGGGAYHAGVEVFGREWSFGATDDGGTGVFCSRPQKCDEHSYLKAMPMGNTKMTETQVLQMIGRLTKEWQGEDYDLLRCNCCHFSEELLRRLNVGPAPRWLNSLAGTGAALDDQVHHAASAASEAKAKAKAVSARIPWEQGFAAPPADHFRMAKSSTSEVLGRVADRAKGVAAAAHAFRHSGSLRGGSYGYCN